MPLTLRADGTQAANRVMAAWFNDFYNLLTGQMTDQPVTIANTITATRQGSTSARTDLLLLKTTVSAAKQFALGVDQFSQFQVYDLDNGKTLFTASASKLELSSTYSWNGALSGSNRTVLGIRPTDGDNWGLYIRTDNSVAFYDGTTNRTTLTVKRDGGVDVDGALTSQSVTASGTVSAANISLSGALTATASNSALELGNKAAANTPYIDFNSSGFNNDNDVRLIASGGVNGSNNQGTLNILGNLQNNSNFVVRFRAKGTGATAGKNIWICPTGTDPTAADGLVEGDLVFSY